MISFVSAPHSLTDAPARQRHIGRALRRQYQSVASQSVPDQMLDLLRQADERWFAAGREFIFKPSRVSTTSLTIAMAIIGTLIALWAAYAGLNLALVNPFALAGVAGVAGLIAIVAGAVWLIEDI